MNHLDRIRLTRILDAAGHDGKSVLQALDNAGIILRITYEESSRVHMNNVEHDL